MADPRPPQDVERGQGVRCRVFQLVAEETEWRTAKAQARNTPAAIQKARVPRINCCNSYAMTLRICYATGAARMFRPAAWTRKHAKLSLALVVLALIVRALLPVGFMVSSTAEQFLTVTICADASGTPKQMQIAIPAKNGVAGDHAPAAEQGQPCAFSGLGHAALDGVDPVLLAAAIAFVLLAGFAPQRQPALRDVSFLRPPLRGPPSPTT